MRAGAVAFAVAIVVVAGVLFLRHRPPAGPLLPPPAHPSTPVATDPVKPEAAGRETPDAAPEKPPVPAPTAAGSTLRGFLRGKVLLPPGSEAALHLSVLAIGDDTPDDPIPAPVAQDGTVDCDISPFLVKKLGTQELEVAADHPECLPASVRVAVPPPEARREGVDLVLPFEIRLEAAAVLRGRVADAAGSPLAEAAAAAFAFLESGPAPGAVDRAAAAEDGGYRLRLRRGERYLVVAAAEGRLPGSVPATGGDVAAPDILLADGASIAGTVTDGEGRPRKGAVLEAHPTDAPGGVELRAGDRDVLWSEGRLSASSARAATGEDGRYAIGGLDAAEYAVSVEELEGSRDLPDAFRDLRRRIQAPATGQDFVVTFVRVTLSVLVDGKPAANMGVLLSGGRNPMFSAHFGLDGAGRTVFLARSGGGSYEARMWEGGASLGERTLEVPAGAGRHEATLEFERPRPKGVLAVVLEPPAGSPPVLRSGFGFHPPGNEVDPMPVLTRSLGAEEGRFLVRGLEPGPYRMAVRAGGGWYGGEGMFLDRTVEVEVPPSGSESVVRVPLLAGGRLRIAARNREGQFQEADCTIRNESGREVPVMFFAKGSGGAYVGTTGGLVAGSENGVSPALPPGRYLVTISKDGYLERTVPVDVKAGESALCDVVLERL